MLEAPEKKTIRPSVKCRVKGEVFEVFMGGDGQLWRWVTPEVRARTRNTQSLQLGQNTVAKSGQEALDFLEAFAIDDKDGVKERWIQRTKAKR